MLSGLGLDIPLNRELLLCAAGPILQKNVMGGPLVTADAEVAKPEALCTLLGTQRAD